MAVDRCQSGHQTNPARRFPGTQGDDLEFTSGRGGSGACQQGCAFLRIGSDGFLDQTGNNNA